MAPDLPCQSKIPTRNPQLPVSAYCVTSLRRPYWPVPRTPNRVSPSCANTVAGSGTHWSLMVSKTSIVTAGSPAPADCSRRTTMADRWAWLPCSRPRSLTRCSSPLRLACSPSRASMSRPSRHTGKCLAIGYASSAPTTRTRWPPGTRSPGCSHGRASMSGPSRSIRKCSLLSCGSSAQTTPFAHHPRQSDKP